ncbi:MAG: undecaprenyl-phosphate alpha-N-acetylglucosaminyl 1-phosphate transferase [Gammaproteobacteria bacterium]
MNSVALILAFLTTGASLLALRPVAVKVGLVDIPGGRKTHVGHTPLVGGLGIYLGLLVLCLLAPGVLPQYASLLSLSALILFIGLVDDAKDLSWATRMTGHSLVALVMAVVAGVQLESLGALFTDSPILLGNLAIPFTVFATVGVINAINMSDGIDGLSGGLMVVALAFMALLALDAGQIGSAAFMAGLICAILGFLSLNFRRPWNRKALVYLGDAGSTMLGFILAWLLIDSTQGESAMIPPVFVLWFLAIPLFDTVNLLIKRPLAGKSPFTPGNDHLHHSLLARGYSVERTVVILSTAALVMGGIGLAGFFWGIREAVMFQIFLTLFGLYFIFSDSLRPAESRLSL